MCIFPPSREDNNIPCEIYHVYTSYIHRLDIHGSTSINIHVMHFCDVHQIHEYKMYVYTGYYFRRDVCVCVYVYKINDIFKFICCVCYISRMLMLLGDFARDIESRRGSRRVEHPDGRFVSRQSYVKYDRLN